MRRFDGGPLSGIEHRNEEYRDNRPAAPKYGRRPQTRTRAAQWAWLTKKPGRRMPMHLLTRVFSLKPWDYILKLYCKPWLVFWNLGKDALLAAAATHLPNALEACSP